MGILPKILESLPIPTEEALDWIVSTGKIRSLRHVQKFEDACTQAAWKAHLEHRKIEALGKWEIVMREWPDQSLGYCGVTAMAHETGQLPYAVKTIDKALGRFPDDPVVISAAARIRAHQGDWASSVALWEKIINSEHTNLDWYHSYGSGLLTLGRFDTIEPLLRDLRQRYPDYPGFMQLQAMLAEARQNYDQSLALWREFRRLYPDDPVGWEHYGRVHQARELALVDDLIGDRGPREPKLVIPDAPVEVDVIDDAEMRTMLLTFESVGSTCEFGLVQRRFGAEPLGLLRFNSVRFGGLVAALTHRFVDMGKPEKTVLVCAPNGEYYLRDRRWDLDMHTFTFKGQQDPDVLYAKFCKRSAYLKDKFVSDLSEAKKVIVYLSSALTKDDLLTMHRAFRSIGPITLLYVKPVTSQTEGIDEGRAGEVIKLDRDLYVGFLSRIGNAPDGSWNIAFEDWVSIVRKVRAADDDRRDQRQAGAHPVLLVDRAG